MEGLARQAGVGVGTVYERWTDRSDVIRDVVESLMSPNVLGAMASVTSAPFEERLSFLYDSDDGRSVLKSVAETLFAVRDDDDIAEIAMEVVESLVALLSGHEWGEDADAMTWWLTVLAIGWGTLLLGEMKLPPMGPDLRTLANTTACTIDVSLRGSVEPPAVQVAEAKEEDEIARKILTTARDMLAHGDEASLTFTTRAVGRAAQVSMKALYRRYGSRAELIQRVLLSDMNADRFGWSDELLEVLIHPNPVVSAAEVLARTLRRVYEDQAAARMLLEVTVAARADATVRTGVVTQVRAAAEARTELIRQLQDAEVVTRTLTPEGLSWFTQAVPIGVRLLAAVGRVPTDAEVVPAMLGVCGRIVWPDQASGKRSPVTESNR